MVTRFGMTESLGPVTYGTRRDGRFLPVQGVEDRNFSEETARAIDDAVRQIIDSQHARSLSILRERHIVLDRIATELLEKETLDRDELEALVREAGFDVRQPRNVPRVAVLPGVEGERSGEL